MKRIITLFFAAMLAGQAWAEQFTVNNLVYTVINATNHYVSVGGVQYKDYGNLVIPATVEYDGVTYTVTSLQNYPGFSKNYGLKSVTIPSTIQTIDFGAFYALHGLGGIYVSEDHPNYTTVDGDLFSKDSTKLIYCRRNRSSYTVPDYVTIIGNGAFSSNNWLTSVVIPNSVTVIEASAFFDCGGLQKVNIPNSVTSIGASAFTNCKNLKPVEFPNSLTSIGSKAFERCVSFKTINLPSSITSVGSNAFSEVNPSSITIETDIDLSGAGLKFTKDGWSFNVRSKGSVEIAYNSSYTGDIEIPTAVAVDDDFTVTRIGNGAFKNCTSLTSVIVPETITSIGREAFASCSGLKSITLPETIESISESTFEGSGLATINIPGTITNIGKNAFKNCSELTTVTIPNTVTTIGEGAFSGCSNLTSVTINADIDFNSANICFVVDGIKYKVLTKNTVEVVKNSYTGEVNIPASITVGTTFSVASIAEKAFEDCTDLTSVVIPNSVTTIGAAAFRGCTGLASLTISKSVTSIGISAFYNSNVLLSLTTDNDAVFKNNKFYIKNDGIKYLVLNKDTLEVVSNSYTGDVVIPETVAAGNNFKVASIADNAFKNCTNLTSITIPSTVTKIGKDAFYGCSGLTKAEFASIEGLMEISYNNYASNPLSYAKHLYIDNNEVKDLVIPDGVTSIGDQFYTCQFTSITIPNSVTKVANDAFKGSKNTLETLTYDTDSLGDSFKYFSMKEVNIGNSVTQIAKNAFYGCSNLQSVTIPNSVKKISNYAFYNCKNLQSVILSDSLTSIGYYAFYNCSKIKSLEIFISVAKIDSKAFANCSNITFYCEANSNPSGWSAGWNNGCPVIWGGNADAYPADNFTFEIIDNESLTAKITGYTGTNPNVIIPQKAKINGKDYTVTTIGKRVFDSNSTLRSVFIPHTISNVESLAFGKNHYEAIIFCEAAGDDNTVPDGWASNWYGTSVPAIAYNAHIDNGFVYQITDKSARKAQIIRYMGENDTVVVPEKINGGTYTVNSIDSYAFYECNALKAIDIPSSITEIGNYAFYGSKIESLTLNSNAIGTNFQNSSSLKTVHLGSNVTSLPDWAFSHSGLEEITFSESVKTVGSNAFAGCSNLKKAEFANIESLCAIDFDIYESNPMEITHSLCINGEEVIDVYIPNTVSRIGSRAFSGCSNLASVAIPKSVTSIGEKAFQNCSNMTIFCEAKSQPEGWNEKWNPDDRPVVWGLYTDKKIWQATITPNNSEYGSVEGCGYVIDSTVTTITATPADGYHFVAWSDKNTDNQRVIDVTSDTLLTALFEAHKVVVDSAVAATCTESGLTEGSHCSVCGVVLVEQDTIPAKGHTIFIDEAVEPTCTETGLGEGKHCAVCDEYDWTQELLPALGHEFVNYIYNNDATTEADGTETAVCERGCGATDTRIAEGTKLATAISESAAGNLMVHAHGKSIIVENADDEIRVYDAMGRMVCRDAINRVRTELTVNTPGVYLVKVGNVTKRVMVNE